MSSPVRVLEPVASVSRTRNAKRRILSDSEDAEERDQKRVKPQDAAGDQAKGRDAREKKKRRKKRRKMSVVESAPDSDPESPTVAIKPTLSRVRSRSVTGVDLDDTAVAFPGKLTRDNTPEPSAGPSSMPVVEAKLEPPLHHTNHMAPPSLGPYTTAKASTSVDKGKGRATPEAAIILNDPQQLSDLQKQVADKTNLVSKHETLVSSLQQSLSCQICLDLMHRPYALAPCGHSACYQCLVNWFKAPPPDVPPDEVISVLHRKKTCPHCRAVVRDRPIEIWSLKDMVATLVKSGLATGLYNSAPEPLESGSNADPWTGIFRAAGQNGIPGEPYPGAMLQLMGARDDEDNVYRCIECHHEIWDGICSYCAREYPGHNEPVLDFDYSSDSSSDGDFPFGNAARAGLRSLFRHLLQPPAAPQGHDHHLVVEDEPVDRDWDGGGDTEIESADEDFELSARQRAARRTAARARGLVVASSDEDDEAGYESSFIDDGDALPHGGDANVHNPIDDGAHHDQDGGHHEDGEGGDDDDSVDVRLVPLRAPRLSTRRRGAFIVSDDENHHDEDGSISSDSHDEDDEDEDLADEVAAREFELYGDDGSIPRGGVLDYESYDSEDEFY